MENKKYYGIEIYIYIEDNFILYLQFPIWREPPKLQRL